MRRWADGCGGRASGGEDPLDATALGNVSEWTERFGKGSNKGMPLDVWFAYQCPFLVFFFFTCLTAGVAY